MTLVHTHAYIHLYAYTNAFTQISVEMNVSANAYLHKLCISLCYADTLTSHQSLTVMSILNESVTSCYANSSQHTRTFVFVKMTITSLLL